MIRMKVTHVEYDDVEIEAPEGQPWPDYAKPAMWARGREELVRPELLHFRVFPGRPLNGYILQGPRVLKAGGTGKLLRIHIARTVTRAVGSAEPPWAQAAVDEALAEIRSHAGVHD